MERIPKHIASPRPLENEGALLIQLSGTELAAHHAFEIVYRHYQPKLSRYILPFLEHSDPDTKEVIQILFIKLWQKMAALIVIRNFDRYIFRMARNATWDFLREKKSDPKKVKLLPEHEDEYGFAEADGQISGREYEDEAKKALSLLPVRRRRIFLLHSHEDKSLDEIAREMGVSKAVVKKQLHLATSFLRKFIMQSHKKVISILLLLTFFC